MNNNLLSKLAFTGLKNNKKAVLPYVLVSAITVMVFHILQSLIDSKFLVNNGKTAFYGADYIVLFMGIGSIAVGIFSVIFILYGNQFVMKGRKKEIGLYGVLGLSKKDVSFVLFIENLIMSASAGSSALQDNQTADGKGNGFFSQSNDSYGSILFDYLRSMLYLQCAYGKTWEPYHNS